ncbi:MAG: hypothetical protein MI745_17395 [Pseudomonadales bacterium]|nr:hypothetical protein [Pseudomonadales bacterium]
MKNLIIIVIVVIAGYKAWEQLSPGKSVSPLESRSYIAVYGRDNCGWTQRALKELARSGVNYKYYVVDHSPVAEQLHARMEQSGISTRRYNLPVIDVNGELMVRPELGVVMEKYKNKLYEQAGYR